METRTIQVKKVCKLNANSLKKDDSFNEIKYLDTSNITRNKIETLQILRKGQDKFPSRAKRKVKDGTIIYSTVRPNQEHYGYLEKPDNNLIISTGFVTLDVADANIDKKYLYYLLTRKEITAHLHTIAANSVSSYPSINPNDIGNLKFDIPVLKHNQEKIADILSILDEKIDLNNKINTELESMAKLIYDYWFVQFDFPDENGKPYKSSGGKMVWNEKLKREIPEGWEDKTLNTIFEFQKGVEPGSSEYLKSKENQHCIKFYRVGDVDGDPDIYVDSTKNKYTLARERDVVVTFDGSVGKIGFGINGAISGGLRKIYDKNNIFDNSLIYFIFRDERIIATIHKYSYGSILLHASSSIQHLKVPFDKNRYIKYQEIVKPVFENMVKNKIENKQLMELRDFLLPMLMNGQVTVK